MASPVSETKCDECYKIDAKLCTSDEYRFSTGLLPSTFYYAWVFDSNKTFTLNQANTDINGAAIVDFSAPDYNISNFEGLYEMYFSTSPSTNTKEQLTINGHHYNCILLTFK